MYWDVLHFQTRAWWQKIESELQIVTKTKHKIREEQLSVIQGLAMHKEKQRVWKLPCAPEPEDQAAGSYSVAQGALQGILGDLGGGHVVEAFGNVRGDLHDEGPALEQGHAGDGGGAEGQLLLGFEHGKVGVGKGAEGQLLQGQVLEAVGKVLKGLSAVQVDNMKGEQEFKRAKTVEVARQQCKELVVGGYIYEKDQS